MLQSIPEMIQLACYPLGKWFS